jgi:predicted nucleic acid-binding protein
MSKRLSPLIGSRWSRPLGTDARLDGGRRRRTPGQERTPTARIRGSGNWRRRNRCFGYHLLELAHGITRADTSERRERRQRFLDELLTGVPIQPVTVPIALRAGQIDGQSQAKGVRIPLSDLLIGASALELGYGVGTANVRHFQLIPGLNVIHL